MGNRMNETAFDLTGLIELSPVKIDIPEIDFSEILKEFGDISLSDIFENITGETVCEKKAERKRKPQARKPLRKRS
jgi:hypothetical protein